MLTLSQSTKNKTWMIKLTIDQLFYYQLFQKYLKMSFIHSKELCQWNIFTNTVWIQKRAFVTEYSFTFIKKLVKIARCIWSGRDRIDGPQQSIWLSSPWPHCETCCLWFWQYGFSFIYWLLLLFTLFTNRLQRAKTGSIFSSYLEISHILKRYSARINIRTYLI